MNFDRLVVSFAPYYGDITSKLTSVQIGSYVLKNIRLKLSQMAFTSFFEILNIFYYFKLALL